MSSKSEQKERTRAGIVESAIRVVRDKGIRGARVSDVMDGVGLTVGGFYAHFASKDALVEAAIRRASALVRARLFAGLDEKPADARAEVVMKRYLSAAHRDDVGGGCPFPAIASEVGTQARGHAPVVAEELERFTADLLELLPRDRPGRRDLALGLIALMVGSLTLARGVRGTPLADDILRSSRSVARALLEAPSGARVRA